jgi:hypothetical protein
VVAAVAGGGSSPTARSVAAILVWWGILATVALGLAPRAPVPRAAVACAGLLAALALLALLSAGWAPSAERAWLEADRLLLYAGLVLVPVLLARRGDAARWADAMALAIVVVALLALGQRLLPALFPADDLAEQLPNAATRLSYPLGYWNGLAILVALGFPLLLRAAVVARGPLWRAAALAPLPALAATIYLTSSRGGVAVAAIGGVACAVLAGRVRALVALVVGALGAIAGVAIVAGRSVLVDGPFETAAAEDAGFGAALLIALACLVTGIAFAAIAGRVPIRSALPRPAWAVAGAAVAVAALAADPAERLRAFRAPPPVEESPGAVDVGAHLASGGGSGRWQFWDAAVEQWREHPVAGDGAGSFEAWWAQHGSLDWFVRNAHSLWLETLGELGLAGLALLVGAFGVGVAAGLARLRGREDEERVTLAALLAVVGAFAVGAAIDWVWQLPAIAAIALLSLGLLSGPATATATATSERRARDPRRAARAAVAVAACAVLVAQAIPFLSELSLNASQRAAARGELVEALERARSAEAIQPWAASPRLQAALVHEQLGQLPEARAALAAAVERDRSDWRLQVVGARLAVKDGDVAAARSALARARALNPRSQLIPRPAPR